MRASGATSARAVTRYTHGRGRVIIEPDRAAAIGQAVALAAPGDVIVVAGKGHETGQYVAGAVLPFDDRQVTAEALERQAKSQDSWTVTR